MSADTMVPGHLVARHIAALRAEGWSLITIAAAARVPENYVQRFSADRARRMPEWTRADAGRAILALPISPPPPKKPRRPPKTLHRPVFLPAPIQVSRAWVDQAACRGTDPRIFDGYGPYPEQAHRLCDGCPVRDACLLDALAHEGATSATSRDGLRGGRGPQERYLMGARARAAVAR